MPDPRQFVLIGVRRGQCVVFTDAVQQMSVDFIRVHLRAFARADFRDHRKEPPSPAMRELVGIKFHRVVRCELSNVGDHRRLPVEHAAPDVEGQRFDPGGVECHVRVHHL